MNGVVPTLVNDLFKHLIGFQIIYTVRTAAKGYFISAGNAAQIQTGFVDGIVLERRFHPAAPAYQFPNKRHVKLADMATHSSNKQYFHYLHPLKWQKIIDKIVQTLHVHSSFCFVVIRDCNIQCIHFRIHFTDNIVVRHICNSLV